jgi:hypothetical protein
MPIYANVVRVYEGDPCLYDAVQKLSQVTLNTKFSCGGPNGTWSDDPLREIKSGPAPMPAAICELYAPAKRTLAEPLPALFAAVKDAIATAWQPGAFHLVFHSSGYDSRIISTAIHQLLRTHGSEWLGEGLLFLSNRWEADDFRAIMQAQDWDERFYAAFDEGSPDEHYATAVHDVWRCAPCPIPGNLWSYLPKWAASRGLMPDTPANVQAFSGLWANETWNAWLEDPNPWQYRVNTHLGYNAMASLPIWANWTEFPLVAANVLDILRRVTGWANGDVLRKELANAVCPQAAGIPRSPSHDHHYAISERLQRELGSAYASTEWGRRVPWTPPTHADFSTQWGRWSTAMMVEHLLRGGKRVV